MQRGVQYVVGNWKRRILLVRVLRGRRLLVIAAHLLMVMMLQTRSWLV